MEGVPAMELCRVRFDGRARHHVSGDRTARVPLRRVWTYGFARSRRAAIRGTASSPSMSTRCSADDAFPERAVRVCGLLMRAVARRSSAYTEPPRVLDKIKSYRLPAVSSAPSSLQLLA